jgi:hypothetical protein
MSVQESQEEIYKRTKKRLADYKFRSFIYEFGALVLGALFMFSFIPVVPLVIGISLQIPPADPLLYVLWFVCAVVFGVSFWNVQRLSKKIEEKYGVTFEERMYVPAYEALFFLKESSDPNHPVMSSKLKAERRIQSILTLFGQITISNVALLHEERVQLWHLWNNLRTRLLPLIRRNDTKAHPLLIALVDYLSRPELPRLKELNTTMASIPEMAERNIFLYIRTALLRRSNLRHIIVLGVFALIATGVYYVHRTYFDAPPATAFQLGLMFGVGLAGIYVGYLGLTKRKGTGT